MGWMRRKGGKRKALKMTPGVARARGDGAAVMRREQWKEQMNEQVNERMTHWAHTSAGVLWDIERILATLGLSFPNCS